MKGLTGAAGKALDQHLDDLRRRVIREASRGVQGSVGTLETRAAIARIALADRLLPRTIFDLISMLSRPPYAAAYLTGTLVVTLVAATAVITTAKLSISPLAGAFFGALVGTIVTLLTGLVLGAGQTRRARAWEARAEVTAEFLKRFTELEEVAAEFSGHRLSLRETLNTLVGHGIWTKDDVVSFGRLLRLRNAFVHERAVAPSQTDLATMMLEIDRLYRLCMCDFS